MRPLFLLTLIAALVAAPAHAARTVTDPSLPRALPADGAVSVEWTDPAQFSDLRFSNNRWEAQQGDWVTQLARHLQERAQARLPAGQRMDVTITDIQRAGRYEPGAGINYSHIRVMREIYPPRMTLNLRITGADGQVLAEGERKLSDMSYLQTGSTINTDNLRYEKRMIDDWLRRELPSPQAVARGDAG
ncbi:DUF3016 domain-containing protein [Pseudoxanthomonas daejeonensis]|uniref:DUF3016 domain-containing protein n=1 Tax=Pseudoxanthomonas daejeonensis TaxID=266062 RepID=A0ABQ6Z3K1_9GAMM|nr:DUF3016 domain-containing protein [Pseudoxanthomonas daejeonensis]KAF1692192.1 hypothetical protein CSC65_14595 [Pseudoxanthomonas daejeonensis]UNK56253.1 DUF3016 domain-containing protein [Pseudoxanthomonas daejeonensis]